MRKLSIIIVVIIFWYVVVDSYTQISFTPEVSQLYGEILGLYIYSIWKNKFNSNINFIELYDMTNLQQNWLKECYKSSKKSYFNSITHHLFITPYLINA